MKAIHLVTGLAMACTLALPVQAFNPQPDPPARIGSISLTPGQTLRVNVRVARVVAISASDVPPGPCRVSLGFVDGAGHGLGQTAIVLLRQGHASRLDLIGDEVSSTSNPLSVHPVVRVLPAVQRSASNAVSCAYGRMAACVLVSGSVSLPGRHPLSVMCLHQARCATLASSSCSVEKSIVGTSAGVLCDQSCSVWGAAFALPGVVVQVHTESKNEHRNVVAGQD